MTTQGSTSTLGMRLERHLVRARVAATSGDLLDLAEHGHASLQIVAGLEDAASPLQAAHLAVVAAAVDFGIRAARRGDWLLAWAALDAVHNCGMVLTFPNDWDTHYFLETYPTDLDGKDDQLTEAITTLRAYAKSASDVSDDRSRSPEVR